jgi:hypothetical protein
MLPNFRSDHCSTFWRATYLICTVLVFSYILFDVLDLDGSDFPLQPHPLQRTSIVAEVSKDVKRSHLPDRIEPRVDLVLFPIISGESLRFRLTKVLTFSPVGFARTRGYRVALPRSSPTDPFHSSF